MAKTVSVQTRCSAPQEQADAAADGDREIDEIEQTDEINVFQLV